MADGLSLDVGLALDESSLTSFKSSLNGALGSVGGALKTGFSAVGSAVTAVGGAAKAAGQEIYNLATDCASAGDKIDKQSQALGLSREAYQEWDYILSQNGASIDSMGTALKTLNTVVDDAANGSSSATEKFERLGISVDDLKGKSREEIFEMTIAGLQGVEDASEKAAIANDLLGKQSVNMAALLNGSAEGVEKLKENAHTMGIVLNDEAVDASVAFTDSMDNLTRSFGAFKNKVGAEFLPGITGITDGLTMLMSGDFEGGMESIKTGISSIVGSLGETLQKGVEIIGELLPTLLPALGEAVVSLLTGVMGVLTENAQILADTVVQLVTMLAMFIVENLPLLIDAALKMVIALAEGLAGSVEQLIPAVVVAITQIVTTLIDNLPLLIQAALTLVQALANGILAALPELVKALPQVISAITNFIANNLPEIIGMGIEIIISLAGGIVQAIPQLIACIPQLIGALLEALGGVIVGVVGIGKNIVTGLWDGISQMASWIKQKVTGFLSTIVEGAKQTLGIHSPSTVFAEMGGYMSEGMGIGFEENMPNIDGIIQDNLPTTSSLSTDFNISENLKVSASRTAKASKNSGYGDIILQFTGNTFTDKAGLKKVAQDLKAILQEDGLRTGQVLFA